MKGFSLCPRSILFNVCRSRGAQKTKGYLPKQQKFICSYNGGSVFNVR